MDAQEQFEITWILTNISAGTHEQAITVLPTAPYLINLIASSNKQLVEQAAWALGNLAADSPECRAVLVKNGAIPAVMKLMHPPGATLLVAEATMRRRTCLTATWCMTNLLSSPDALEISHCAIDLGLVPVLQALLNMEDDTFMEAAWLLATLLARPAPTPAPLSAARAAASGMETDAASLPQTPLEILLAARIDTVVLRRLAAACEVPPVAVGLALPCLRILSACVLASSPLGQAAVTVSGEWLCSSSEATATPTAVALDRTVILPTLMICLQHSNRAVRKETAYLLSNCAAVCAMGPHITALPGLLALVVQGLEGDLDVSRELVYTCYNLVADPQYVEET